MGLECVVNVSEGRDELEVSTVWPQPAATSLLDVHRDPDHHRSVLTLAGPGRDGRERRPHARRAPRCRRSTWSGTPGVHPTFGVVDVVPVRGPGRPTTAALSSRPAGLVPPRLAAAPPLDRAVDARDRFARWAGPSWAALLPLRAAAADRAPHPPRGPPGRLLDPRTRHRTGAAAPPGRRVRRRRPALPGGLQPVGGRGGRRPGPLGGPGHPGPGSPGARLRAGGPAPGVVQPGRSPHHRPGRGATTRSARLLEARWRGGRAVRAGRAVAGSRAGRGAPCAAGPNSTCGPRRTIEAPAGATAGVSWR